MERNIRYYFFCPLQKVDNESQSVMTDIVSPDVSLNETLRNHTIDTVLERSFKKSSKVDELIINNLSKYICFFNNVINDNRFDSILPTNDMFSDLEPSLIYTLGQDKFTISINNNDTKNYVSDYNSKSMEYLEPLGSGYVNSNLYYLIEKAENINWISGSIVVRVMDHRTERDETFHILLEMPKDSIHKFLKDKVSDTDYVNSEQKLMLLANPGICLEPNLDVARIQTLFDFRRKMWTINRELSKDDFEQPKKQRKEPIVATNIRIGPLRGKIEIPETLTPF